MTISDQFMQIIIDNKMSFQGAMLQFLYGRWKAFNEGGLEKGRPYPDSTPEKVLDVDNSLDGENHFKHFGVDKTQYNYSAISPIKDISKLDLVLHYDIDMHLDYSQPLEIRYYFDPNWPRALTLIRRY